MAETPGYARLAGHVSVVQSALKIPAFSLMCHSYQIVWWCRVVVQDGEFLISSIYILCQIFVLHLIVGCIGRRGSGCGVPPCFNIKHIDLRVDFLCFSTTRVIAL